MPTARPRTQANISTATATQSTGTTGTRSQANGLGIAIVVVRQRLKHRHRCVVERLGQQRRLCQPHHVERPPDRREVDHQHGRRLGDADAIHVRSGVWRHPDTG